MCALVVDVRETDAFVASAAKSRRARFSHDVHLRLFFLFPLPLSLATYNYTTFHTSTCTNKHLPCRLTILKSCDPPYDTYFKAQATPLRSVFPFSNSQQYPPPFKYYEKHWFIFSQCSVNLPHDLSILLFPFFVDRPRDTHTFISIPILVCA